MQESIMSQLLTPAANLQAFKAVAPKAMQTPAKSKPAGFDRILKSAANRQDSTQDAMGKTVDKSTDAVKKAFEDSHRTKLASDKRDAGPQREPVESKSSEEQLVDKEVSRPSSQDNSAEAANAAAMPNGQAQNQTPVNEEAVGQQAAVGQVTLSVVNQPIETKSTEVPVIAAQDMVKEAETTTEQDTSEVTAEQKTTQNIETKPTLITGTVPEQSKTDEVKDSAEAPSESKTKVEVKASDTTPQPAKAEQAQQREASQVNPQTAQPVQQQAPSLETKKQDETPQVKVQVENPAVASKSAAEQVVGQAQIMNPNQKDENGVGDKNTDTVAGEKTSKDAPVIKVVDQKDSSQTQQDNKNNTPNQESNNQSSKTDVKKLIDSETGKLRGLSKSEAVAETTDSSNQNTTTTVNRVDTAENTVKSTAVKQEMQAPKLDTKDIMNQIVQKAEVMVKDNKSAITIDLKPEFLGKLQISLSVQDGVVTARFTTENQNVKQLLEGGLSQLKSVFENNGIKLEKAEVNVDLGNSGSSYQGFNESQGRQDRYTELPDRWWDNRRESGDYTPLQQVQQLIDEPSVNYTGDGVNFLI